ncbi:MAG: hypothetical protein WDW36_000016 [Sanguina aurantia]
MALDLDSAFEANGRSLGALIGSLLVGALANAAGVGGGAIYIPLFHVIVGFALKPSTVLSQAVITAGAIISVGLKLPNRHPAFPQASLIDFTIVLALTPILLVGVSAGVLLNVLLAEWLITFLLLILLALLSVQSVTKGVKLWQQESRAFQAERCVQLPLYLCPETRRPPSGELHTDAYASLDCLEGCGPGSALTAQDGSSSSSRGQEQDGGHLTPGSQPTHPASAAYVPFTYRSVFNAIYSLESFEGLDYSSAGAPWQTRHGGGGGVFQSRPSFSLHARADRRARSGLGDIGETSELRSAQHSQRLLLLQRQGSSDAPAHSPSTTQSQSHTLCEPPAAGPDNASCSPPIRHSTDDARQAGDAHLSVSREEGPGGAPLRHRASHGGQSDSALNDHHTNTSRLLQQPDERTDPRGPASESWLLRRSAWRQRVHQHQHAALATDDPLALVHSNVEALDLSGWRAQDGAESAVRPTAAAAHTAAAVAAATARHTAATARHAAAAAAAPARPAGAPGSGGGAGSGAQCRYDPVTPSHDGGGNPYYTLNPLGCDAVRGPAQQAQPSWKRQADSGPPSKKKSCCFGCPPDVSALPCGLVAKTVGSWLLFVGLQLGKSVVRTCSSLYWGLYAAQVVAMLLISLTVIVTGRGPAVSTQSAGGEGASPTPSSPSSRGSRVACLGWGGGMLMGPLLLEMGIIPQVTSATSSVMVLFSSSAALIQFAILRLVNLDYALVFGAAGMVSAVLGVILSAVLLARLNRPSIIVISLSGVIVMGTGLVCIFGLMSAVKDLQSHQHGFGTLCPG